MKEKIILGGLMMSIFLVSGCSTIQNADDLKMRVNAIEQDIQEIRTENIDIQKKIEGMHEVFKTVEKIKTESESIEGKLKDAGKALEDIF